MQHREDCEWSWLEISIANRTDWKGQSSQPLGTSQDSYIYLYTIPSILDGLLLETMAASYSCVKVSLQASIAVFFLRCLLLAVVIFHLIPKASSRPCKFDPVFIYPTLECWYTSFHVSLLKHYIYSLLSPFAAIAVSGSNPSQAHHCGEYSLIVFYHECSALMVAWNKAAQSLVVLQASSTSKCCWFPVLWMGDAGFGMRCV